MIPISLIRILGIDESEFNFQFQSHPNYPSALALSDTLNFLGVGNTAYELEKEYWNEISDDFITLYNQQFALVKKLENSEKYNIVSNQNLIVDENDLLGNTSNLMILLNDINGENHEKKSNSQLYLIIFFTLALIILLFNFSWSILVYNLLSLFGIYISYEIFKEKLGESSLILNTICGKVDTESNCNKVISSDKTKILGLKLSDISLVYFIALFFIGTIIGNISPVILTISACASGIIFYSLYIQIFVENKFCKVCLTIIIILICQLLVAYYYSNSGGFNYKELAISTLLFATTLFATSIYNKQILKNNDLRKSNIKNLKFKRNYELFKRQLLDADQIVFENSYSGFFLGNHNSTLHLTLISNPFCGFCKEAHHIAEYILKKHSKNISIQIRFNFTNQNDDSLKTVISAFKHTYKAFGQNIFLQKVGEWFDKRDLQQLKKEKGNLDVDLTEESNIGVENLELGLTFTPIFLINGYRFPQNYDRDDLLYFIDDLLEDEDLIANKLAEAEKLTE